MTEQMKELNTALAADSGLVKESPQIKPKKEFVSVQNRGFTLFKALAYLGAISLFVLIVLLFTWRQKRCSIGNGTYPTYTSKKTKRVDVWDFNIDGRLTQEHFYKKYIMLNKPLLIKNSIDHWDAMRKWKSDDYFRNQCGNEEIEVEYAKNQKYGFLEPTWGRGFMKFTDFLNEYKSTVDDKYLYLHTALYDDDLLRDDWGLPAFVPCLRRMCHI
jgi:hypothetical protein